MKTAISIPDDIFEAADRSARRLGISRSEFYANAVHEYLERHKIADVTSRLNDLYASENSELDRHLDQMQRQSIEKEDW